MNIVEKWKNRETKKKLKEENIRLKEELKTTRNFNFPVCTVERNIQRVSSEYTVNYFLQNTVPAEIVKEQLMKRMSVYLKNFMNFDFYTDDDGNVVYVGNLYIVAGKED